MIGSGKNLSLLKKSYPFNEYQWSIGNFKLTDKYQVIFQSNDSLALKVLKNLRKFYQFLPKSSLSFGFLLNNPTRRSFKCFEVPAGMLFSIKNKVTLVYMSVSCDFFEGTIQPPAAAWDQILNKS